MCSLPRIFVRLESPIRVKNYFLTWVHVFMQVVLLSGQVFFDPKSMIGLVPGHGEKMPATRFVKTDGFFGYRF